MIKPYLFFLSLFFFSNIYATSIYTWTDKNGVVHYSTKREQGAKVIQLPEPSNNPQIANTAPSNLNNQNNENKMFNALVLISPENYQSFHFNRNKITILALGIEPYLKRNPNNQLRIFIDNKPIFTTSIYPTQISTPKPGQYHLHIAVIDQNGQIIASSKPVIIYILPYPRVEQAGFKKATAEAYQNETSGENYQQFYKEHEDSQITPQKPYQPSWDDYKNQINP